MSIRDRSGSSSSMRPTLFRRGSLPLPLPLPLPLLLLLLLLLSLSACTSGEAPADILPRDRFVQVLAEAQLIEARVNREGTEWPQADSQPHATVGSLAVLCDLLR